MSKMWKTADRLEVRISDMADSHLANSIAKIERSGGSWRPAMLPALKTEDVIRRAGRVPDGVVGVLWRAWATDALNQHFHCGRRTTGYVADGLGITMAGARRLLNDGLEAGEILWTSANDQAVWAAADTPEFRGWQVRVKVAGS